MSKRAKAEKDILELIADVTDNDPANVELHKNWLKSLDDSKFEKVLKDILNDEFNLSIIVPNNGKVKLSVRKSIKIGRKYGFELFQQLWLGNKDPNIPMYLTPVSYMMVKMRIRRASQLLAKKIGVPEHSKAVDTFTGQPTGDSKGSSLTYPELRFLVAMGMTKTATELVKYRGGDKRGYQAMSAMLSKYGRVNQETLEPFSSGVESTRMFDTILTCMHLRSTLSAT